jgi:NAD+ synthase
MLADPKSTKDEVVQWIRDYFEQNGPGCSAVVGISGGKDSSVVAALCVEALGNDHVIGVAMPNGIQSDIEDSYRLIDHLGIENYVVNLEDAYVGLTAEIDCVFGGISRNARINLPARLRMATLYAIAQSLPNGGRVANTCNRSEDYVGYSTKFGDSAGDFSPLANLMVHEVIQIGHELGLPADLVDKTPSDGLCGKTDEDNLGVSYQEIDQFITTSYCENEANERIIEDLHQKNLHKLAPMPTYGTTVWH